jgi:hypothetical protein
LWTGHSIPPFLHPTPPFIFFFISMA